MERGDSVKDYCWLKHCEISLEAGVQLYLVEGCGFLYFTTTTAPSWKVL